MWKSVKYRRGSRDPRATNLEVGGGVAHQRNRVNPGENVVMSKFTLQCVIMNEIG
jgi:hypothetical protein